MSERVRGRGRFEPQALGEGLLDFAPGAEPDAGADLLHARAYRDYYALDYPDIRHSIGWLESGAHRIVAQHFRRADPAGTVVVCHGYYDHVGLYGHLIEFLLAQGFDVLAFDQPGHGLSSGARATIGSFDEYVRALEDTLERAAPALARPWHIVGQSMGGAVTMEFLARGRASDFKTVALLAPLIRPANWGLSRLVYQVARRTITERPRALTANAENPEFLELIRLDPLSPRVLPVAWVTAMVDWMTRFEAYPSLPFTPLVVQGHADRTVGWKHNLKRLRAMTQIELLEIPAARHHLVNESVEIRRQIFDWLGERLRR